MCQFAHIRNYNEDGSIACTGGMTIAFDDLGDGQFTYAIARCHVNDNFNKHLGRVKAAGRLKSRHHRFFVDNIKTTKEFINWVIANHK